MTIVNTNHEQTQPATTEPPVLASGSMLERTFKITQRGSTVKREIRGGIVTFFTMAYIVVLNPLILGGFSPDAAPVDVAGNFLPAAAVGAATGLTAGLLTIVFGLVANLPFGLAAGLGINSFLAVSVIGDVTWPEAMGLVLLNGIVIVIFALTGARTAIFRAIPKDLKAAITVGIGLFITFIGFVDSGFVTRTPAGPPVQLGTDGSISAFPTIVFVIGVVLMGGLVARKVQGGLLIGIIATTILAVVAEKILRIGAASEANPGGWHLNVPELSGQILSIPDFSIVGQFDMFGAFSRIGPLAATMLVFTLVFTNFFDAMGTMTGLAKSANVSRKDGTFPRIKSAFVVEGMGAVFGGMTSTSSNTVYVDSAAGIGEGARTGLASVVTGMLFLGAMFLTPLTSVVPIEVAASALVVVGTMMAGQIRAINFKRFSVGMPAFLTLVTMPLTYSIANGIGVGFISWVLINSLAGRGSKIHPLMWVVSAGFLVYFARGPISLLLGA
ncbi:NCS2 family permease [Paeniglutamicibacter kerguelensis]|uniref:AGZA family xanthine/uracil permease-like MFS transporter n=1 Tax=Paeniglutamicibacter kerguelensis TaxID=254788 RepID=A0ABS4XH93_9MICC|nr:NCS2 family permease [Paeniglutamicibacter kerguelensis]MBP2387623.1 AGZA family xanthine/uracil permease-like MFS transporter [Paeniglutamicibacter kerguelensis]